jgi:hypothetical protein
LVEGKKVLDCGSEKPYGSLTPNETGERGGQKMEKSEKVIESVKFAPFTKNDWMGLGGAEAFPDGSVPLIGYFVLSTEDYDLDAMAVIDANGLTIQVEVPCSEEGDCGEMVDHEETETLEYVWTGPGAFRAIAFLRPTMAEGDLLLLNPTSRP